MTETVLVKYAVMGFFGIGAAVVSMSWLFLQRLPKIAKFFLAGMTVLTLLGIDIFIIETNWIEVKTVKVQDAGLARVLNGTKVVQISDIHLTEGIGFRERLMIRKVNAQNADLILITGDFIDDLSQLDAAREIIRSLKAKQGIYGVPGNTDHIVMDGRMLARELSPAGIDILVNEKRIVRLDNGNDLWLAGVDDPKYRHDNMQRTLGGIPPLAPKIVMAHCPDFIDKFYDEPAFILAGDTHGGQVGIPFLVRASDYASRARYVSGLFKKGRAQMYVSRGIGTKTLPLRFLCRPEITVFEFTP